MISTEEFLTRVEQAAEQHASAGERNKELFKELKALCALTDMTVSQTSSAVWIYGPNDNLIIVGSLDDVVKALVAPPPDDGPFSIFTNLNFIPVDVPVAEAPVHIERRDFTLLNELAECLSDYLDSLA